MMASLKQNGAFQLDHEAFGMFKREFSAYYADDTQTNDTIRHIYRQSNILLDPHTAVGVYAAWEAQQAKGMSGTAYVTLATAHPAKFPEAVRSATDIYPDLPAHLANIFDKDERFISMSNDSEQVKAFIFDIT